GYGVLRGPASWPAHVCRAADSPPRAMRRKPQAAFCVQAARDQDRLGHVERDQRQPAAVGRETRPGRRSALGVIEQPIALAKDEIVLVPEAILALEPQRIGDQIMDGIVIGLGPRSDRLQRLPIGLALIGLGWNPGIVLWGLRRQDDSEPLGRLHAGLVEQGPGLA